MDQNLSLYIENERLRDYAASTARLLRPDGESGGAAAARALRVRVWEIRRCHDAVRRRYREALSVPTACEWLLDNWYLAKREAIASIEALREARRLRLCEEGLLILALARALVRAGLGEVSEARCRSFLDGFQSVTVLRRAELALFPCCLRAACLEELAAVCREMPYSADLDGCAVQLEKLFGTLRLFSQLDPEKLLESADVSAAVLAADPSGVFPRMDAESRQDYLRRLEKLARREGMEEHLCARALIRRAKAEDRHVGFYLCAAPRPERAVLYIAANLLLTLLVSLWAGLSLDSGAAALLLLLPVSELCKRLIDTALLRLLPPRRLPRLDLSGGVPDEGRTLCVLSLLLESPERAHAAARRLEELRFACRTEGRNLRFGLLADLPEADTQETDADAAILAAAAEEIHRLNRLYAGGFYLFTRQRSFDGERWSGKERKRGALLELSRLLCDRPSALSVTGERDALAGTRFLLTLDGDTRITPGAAGELIGTLLHPLNQPVLDRERGVVVSGCGVLQPRLDTDLASANATDFSLVFAGPGGSDPYGGGCGELTMDAFARSGFAGKGLIDLQCLLACSEKHIPDGRVLSHDAPEGALLRAGFIGDAAFSDSFPTRPLPYCKRLHRWVRGDWQNLPFLFSPVLAAIDRWRLFDSLRRSLLPPMTLLAILAGFLLPGTPLLLSALAALLALTGRVFRALAESGLRRPERPRPRHYARLLTGVGGAIVQSFLRLWLLPYESWICLWAAVAALWRMAVSRRNLLQWQTAAQAEQSAGSLGAHIRAFWQSELLGGLLLLFCPVILARSAGFLWLLAPLAAWALGLPASKESALTAADREWLRQAAAESFSYYTRFCTAEDHYLPPDNYQEQPPVGVAHRSSPTNIGLCLLSFAAAVDLGFLTRKEAAACIARMLDTLEELPRYAGHYYNWYDTRTLAPLKPALLSTVDSGNLCASLIALRRALLDFGESALAERVEALCGAMDFSLLYDPERSLFFICYDPAAQRGVGGWYDLMASEAMLTSYLAVARGEAPKKHWRRLGRAQLQKDGFRGLASWTGTMFEYLMPALFLPYERGSLLHESARFCLYAQRRQVYAGKPWGVSESAFYALDPGLSYRYKASGCAALALKRGQDGDMVVAPYASFLALSVKATAAVKNLRRLEQFGARGRFGFYEAIDFTPERCRRDEGEVVRCCMAHHVGMSVLAAANALCDGSIQRRFFDEPAMRACRLLLEERVPAGGAVLRRELTRAPERPPRRASSGWQAHGSADEEAACLLSNGVWSLLAESDGSLRASCGELLIHGAPRLTLCRGESKHVLSRPDWSFAEDLALYSWRDGAQETVLRLCAAGGETGERWEVSLRREATDEALLCLTLPLRLCREQDWRAHPAFWTLGVTQRERDGALLLRRLPRGETPGLWLCALCDGEASLSFDAPLLTLRLPLPARAEGVAALRFALCAASDEDSAFEGAKRILQSEERARMVSAAAARLSLPDPEIGAAMGLLPALRSPLCDAAPKAALWPFGISGELPLLCCRADAREASALLRRFLLLTSCGAEAELVYLSGEEGEYYRPVQNRLRGELRALGLEALLGSRGGVHFAPLSAAEAIESRAVFCVGRERPARERLTPPTLSRPRGGTVPVFSREADAFRFTVCDTLPPRLWQLPIVGSGLGAILTECGIGALWYENAREMRLTEPIADLKSTCSALPLWADTREGARSLFAANDGLPCRVSFSQGWAEYEKELDGRRVRTRVFAEGGALLLLIEGAAGLGLHWAISPTLGPDAASLQCSLEDGVFSAENAESFLPGLHFHALASVSGTLRADFCPAAFLWEGVGEETTVLACGCADRDALLALCTPERAVPALAKTREDWSQRCALPQIRVGDEAVDYYVNHWCVYQTLCCRLLARASLYQSGGAYGFRDQLQDAVNLLPLSPELAKERILDCCRHQYQEGDVMHWWHPHPAGDRGLRSRCSDDLLWLPWALCAYTEASGDYGFALRKEPWLCSPELRCDERDRYETLKPCGRAQTVLKHARAALERCVSRGFGAQGLPLIGSGDWNDGFDSVFGESVWLGFFLSQVSGRFAALLRRLREPDAARWEELSARMLEAAEQSYNGRFYRRGYWPDGTVLGGEERIDLLVQAWAALCGARHADKALTAALDELLDEEHRLLRLFWPPFTEGERSPGYLTSYGPGLRENGGQYTHAAVWLALGLLRRGRRAEALRVLRLLLPGSHDALRYEAEPFVLPADVSSAPESAERAGWTWYTGSAGWVLRAALELNGEGQDNS